MPLVVRMLGVAPVACCPSEAQGPNLGKSKARVTDVG